MPREIQLPPATVRQITAAVDHYKNHRTEFFNLSRRVETDLIEIQQLKAHIHSTKFREKDPEHLRDKLERKARDALLRRRPFSITQINLFSAIDDLAGVRLLHIYRDQLREIDPLIRQILRHHGYKYREKPKAFTWDVENATFYRDLGFRVEAKPSFYTSVHYVVRPAWGNIGCEIQVRTLAEELWGEVSHTVNYPHKSTSTSCKVQLSVLARVASGCTRLVDSIYVTLNEVKRLRRSRGRRA